MSGKKMKAVVYTEYGPPEVLRLAEVDRPALDEDRVLVQVHAVSVNYPDWSFTQGHPFIVRLMGSGLLRPKNRILGADIAGRVEAVGRRVKQFRPGDEVYGDISAAGFGGFAEYVAAPENALAPKPANLTFEEAAAVPMAGVVALQGLRDCGQIRSGQKVLINGASGGIGTFAVQIAKALGAEVTGVCSTRNLDLVRSIGADHIIDYTQQDFARGHEHYDLILGTAGYRSIFDYRRALTELGTYVATGGSMAQIFQPMFLGPWIALTGRQKMTNLSAKPCQADLVFLRELLEAGRVVPVIDKQYRLPEVAEAVRYYGQGHTRGKVVISVQHNGS